MLIAIMNGSASDLPILAGPLPTTTRSPLATTSFFLASALTLESANYHCRCDLGAGKLNFAAKVVKGGCTFIRRIIDLINVYVDHNDFVALVEQAYSGG
jgi:hypothetical protein